VTTPRLLSAVLLLHAAAACAQPAPVIMEVPYDAKRALVIPVRRAVGTTIQLPPGETITQEPLVGQGSDCDNADHQWCVVAAPGMGTIGVKPKAGAPNGNTLTVVTAERTYSFIFNIVQGRQAPALRADVVVNSATADPLQALAAQRMEQALALLPRPEEVIDTRLKARPLVKNSAYTVAADDKSAHIVPSAVFDDGGTTYLEYRGNRPVPAVFSVTPDGQEHMANVIALPDYDLIAVPLVAQGLVLRAGNAVVSVRNSAYDPEGRGPLGGSYAEGVLRQVADPRTGKFKEQ
jgi:type IV secretion system protein VirB9